MDNPSTLQQEAPADPDIELREAVRRRVAKSVLPSSVYRLQMNASCRFADVETLIPYFKSLGIEALYFSPYLQAVPGSLHGYNVTDPNRFNPEIGLEEDFERLAAEMDRHGLRHVADIVPNHMGVEGSSNRYWMDVLENGPSSIYAHFFDIDWDPPKAELKGKVLIPVLGDLYGKVLENAEIRLVFFQGEFRIEYYDCTLPVAPHTYPLIFEADLKDFETRVGGEALDYLELLSILTAFKNLPRGTEGDSDNTRERNREKEITKRRLGALTERSAPVRDFIDTRLDQLNGRKGEAASFDGLDALLGEQSYRMAHWVVASEEINYRRFFNINELAAVRIEDADVFNRVHALIFRLLRENKIHGLRIDHPDGLYDPPTYFSRLQKEFICQTLLQELGVSPEREEDFHARLSVILTEDEFRSVAPLLVVVEKILDRQENLPADWNVHGTVGYDFLNVLNGLFVNVQAAKKMENVYRQFIDHSIDFDELVYDAKKLFAISYMSSELNALGYRLDRISEKNRRYRDFTRHSLTRAIREVIQCFPVYRTYTAPASETVSERDEKYIRMAVRRARKKGAEVNPAIYDFLQDILLLRLGSEVGEEEKSLYRDFVMRFQQLTGPIMAKGLEDTAFYVNNRLLALNEVGGDPSHFGSLPADFHNHNIRQNASWPAGFLPVSTHDTKRSADARFRLDVLSEIPDQWNARIEWWAALNAIDKTELDGISQPRPNTEYFIYQSLLAVWPDGEWSPQAQRELSSRLWSVVEKSLREAKIYTNWITPEPDYEAAVRRFVERLLVKKEFLDDFIPFQKKVSRLGKYNSLSGLVLRLGSPGIIDCYQGDELWDYSLVDPDNRRPVDFSLRSKLLAEVSRATAKDVAGYYTKMDDSRLKLYVLSRGLALRREFPDLFTGGEYEPLVVRGAHADRVVAFLRTRGGESVLVGASRLHTAFGEELPVGDAWEDTEIVLPGNGEWINVLGENTFRISAGTLKVSALFGQMNIGLLKRRML